VSCTVFSDLFLIGPSHLWIFLNCFLKNKLIESVKDLGVSGIERLENTTNKGFFLEIFHSEFRKGQEAGQIGKDYTGQVYSLSRSDDRVGPNMTTGRDCRCRITQICNTEERLSQELIENNLQVRYVFDRFWAKQIDEKVFIRSKLTLQLGKNSFKDGSFELQFDRSNIQTLGGVLGTVFLFRSTFLLIYFLKAALNLMKYNFRGKFPHGESLGAFAQVVQWFL